MGDNMQKCKSQKNRGNPREKIEKIFENPQKN